ncbi:hypothetical protein JMJ58_03685 [Haloterrigena salifodinae]|uniref:Uncharacterized protein n=1 Tax=Haloterrigena salifodinae TaxID=2675099 RepID=A0A8T8E3F8_9EURY|nr:hypothetical protein [Haloterrigena salifodinae]QRV16010.1 hypothetical protein JMJ58_03685 [Haloterrigena salifodinae]
MNQQLLVGYDYLGFECPNCGEDIFHHQRHAGENATCEGYPPDDEDGCGQEYEVDLRVELTELSSDNDGDSHEF